MLSSIYQYGDVAYIGGAFKTGLHNILEASVYGIAVVFGPNFHKYSEAVTLIEQQIGFSIKNSGEFINFMNQIKKIPRNQLHSNAEKYFSKQKGASLKIVNHCEQILNQQKKNIDSI